MAITYKSSIGQHIAVVQVYSDQLFVDSNAIAELFARPHKNVMRDIDALIENGTISRLSLEPRNYTDIRGKVQPSYRLTERDALVLMPFIGGRKAAEGQAKLVDEFLLMRKMLHVIASKKTDPVRQLLVSDKCAMARMMTDCLIDVRARKGKETNANHFINEHRLCNWVLTGCFGHIEDEDLDSLALCRLKNIRRRNAMLIEQDLPRAQRKDALRVMFPPLQLELGQ
jgi:Rha family phage regulatory protein